MEALGPLLGALGALSGRSFGALGRSWTGLWHFLVLLDASGPLWRRPARSPEPPKNLLATILGPSGDDLGTILGGIWEQYESYLVMLSLLFLIEASPSTS